LQTTFGKVYNTKGNVLKNGAKEKGGSPEINGKDYNLNPDRSHKKYTHKVEKPCGCIGESKSKGLSQ
jgi:hypothetical protein